jgi:hypothetical protein
MSYKYTYTKEMILGRLELEIRASTIIVHDLDYMTSLGTTVDIYFKAELTSEEVTALDAIVAAHVPTPLPEEVQTVDIDGAKSNQGHLVVELAIPTGVIGSRSMSLVTHDLSDRTCWYQKSVKVTDETLTDSGNGLTFTSAHPYWVNIYHAKLTYTHKQIPTRTGVFGKHADWAVSVKVDSVVQSASTYSINFASGTITFNSSQSGKTVQATYWHTDGVTNPSEWLLVPPTGKKFIVEHVELQISVGITINDTLRFEIWAGSNLATYSSFPDYLFEAGYGQMRADYRNANDFLNAANLGQGSVPLIGAMTRQTVVLPFNYIQAFALDSAVGAIFRMTMLNNTPYTDTDIATGTFYVQLI